MPLGLGDRVCLHVPSCLATFSIFTGRQHSAEHCTSYTVKMSVCLSVCLSVRLSRSGTVSKRRKLGSQNFHSGATKDSAGNFHNVSLKQNGGQIKRKISRNTKIGQWQDYGKGSAYNNSLANFHYVALRVEQSA